MLEGKGVLRRSICAGGVVARRRSDKTPRRKKERIRMKQMTTLGFLTTGFMFAVSLPDSVRADGLASPNIILILTDDQGWSQTSEWMDPLVKQSKSDYLETPNMDRIAREGMRFTSGYSPAPLCTPTRRSILCGTSAARSGTEFPSETGWVPHKHITVPKAMRMANSAYACAHFGKWGGQSMISTPEECGYVASHGVTDNPEGGMPDSFGFSNHNEAPPHFIDNEDPKRSFSISDDSVAFIREQVAANRPFYVQASYYAPHLSVVCREATLEKYMAKGTPDRGYTPAFAAMLEDLDTGIGRILDVLDELGVADNTYVFFTSDNGGRGTLSGGNTGRLPPNYPLSGAKHSLYEGGIRVPFMVRGPGIPKQSVCRTPVAGYDLLPTFFDLAGGKAELPENVDGGSIATLLKNPAEETVNRQEEALFFHRPERYFSVVRQGKYKLIAFWNSMGAIRGRELYEVDSDPREIGERDIAFENPEKADELQTLLLTHFKNTGVYYPPTAAVVPLEDAAIGQVIYHNQFDGPTFVKPWVPATVSFGLNAYAISAEMDGNGMLVPSVSSGGSRFSVQLSPTPLQNQTVRLKTVLKAPQGSRWIGVGFHGAQNGQLNHDVSNSGPWITVGSKGLHIRGGTAVKGSSAGFDNTHGPGDRLELSMTYYPDRTLDIALNGMVVTNGLRLVHQMENVETDPMIQYLQVQFFQIDPAEGCGVDSVTVETVLTKE
jgi:arylsulfatase A-like enzyme